MRQETLAKNLINATGNLERDLYKQLKNKKIDLRGPEELFNLSLLIGEKIRIEYHGKWVMRKMYGRYNSFHMPIVITGKNKVFNPFQRINSVFKYKKVVNYEKFIQTCSSYLEHLAIEFRDDDHRFMEIDSIK